MTDAITNLVEVKIVYSTASLEIGYYLPAEIRNYNWTKSDDAGECADCGGTA